MRKFILSLVVITFLFQPLFSQSTDTWNLQRCIAYALSNNITIQQSQLTEEMSQYNLLQSKMSVLPSLNGSVNYGFNFGKNVDPTTNQYINQNIQTNSFSLNSGIKLFSGFKTLNEIKQANYDYMASKYNTQSTENNVTLYVVNAFLQVLYAEENLKNTQQQQTLAEQQLERTKTLNQAGTVTDGAVFDMKAQEATAEMNTVSAQNTYDLARLNLTQLLNLDHLIEIEKPQMQLTNDMLMSQLNADSIYLMALQTQPQIQGAQYGLFSAMKGLSIAHSGMYPSISAYGSLSTNYSNAVKNYTVDGSSIIPIGFLQDANLTPVYTTTNQYVITDKPYMDQFKDNVGQNIGISLSIPIFNNWMVNTTIKRAQINVLQAQLTLDQTKQQLQKDVQTAYTDVAASSKRYSASMKNLDAVQKSFDYTQKKFDAGLISSFDFNAALNNLTKAQTDLLQAKFDYVLKLKVLDYYQGKPLNLN